MNKKFTWLLLAALIISLSLWSMDTIVFQYKMFRVTNAPSPQLRMLGQHFIIGYTHVDEVKKLVSKGMIGGIYITKRNTSGKTYDQIKHEIKSLQDIQKGLGLPPLLVATDQEGGAVSRLSPPLTHLPPISFHIDHCYDFRELDQRIIGYASLQASELYNLGVNLNLSPVVDLNSPDANTYQTLKTLIHTRAISNNPIIVTKTALAYCKGYESQSVIPTLKHFPGLGSVREETHEIEGKLDLSLDRLEANDFLPFKSVSRQTRAFIMLGHVKLMSVDPEFPASFSEKVIQGIIRKKWNHDGILITDDFNMGAVKNSPWGIAGASARALNAGADLILLSLDGTRYYEAMHALIRAENQKKLNHTMLYQSSKRLDQVYRQMAPKFKTADLRIKVPQE